MGADPCGRLRRGSDPPPERTAIVDERGTLTFAEVDRRTNALARELGRAGVGEGDGVAIMCRNHRGFIEATVACSKLGAGMLYLNTAFAGPQIADVIERENPVAVIYDEEFAGLVSDGAAEKIRQIIHHRGEIQEARLGLRQVLNKKIKIAVRPHFPTHGGAKQGQFAHFITAA